MMIAFNDILDNIFVWNTIYGGLEEYVRRAKQVVEIETANHGKIIPECLLAMAEWAADTTAYRNILLDWNDIER